MTVWDADPTRGFAHRALEAEQEPVIKARRIVDAVFVEDQGVGKGADLQQTLPVSIVARQAGDFQTHHDPGASHADVADQTLEALAPGRRRAGFSLIGVDDDDLLVAPAEGNRTTAKRILPSGALGILDDLPHRRLADVQIGAALEVMRLDFEMGIHDTLLS